MEPFAFWSLNLAFNRARRSPEKLGADRIGRIFTVGHSTRSIDDFAELVRAEGVGRIADVRRFPASRRHPHFTREVFEKELSERGIAYEWWGEELGGRRSSTARSRHTAWRNDAFQGYADHMDTVEFRAALTRLEEEVTRPPPTAIMCAESLWWKCHRRLIADALTMRGAEVTHILGPGTTQAHKPHPEMRRGEDGYPVYDLGEKPLF
jgi:uncharacterized protein (DUF488 family)